MMKFTQKLCALTLAASAAATAFALPAAADWMRVDENWRYTTESGSYIRGRFQQIGGSWYMFDADGNMVTGWYNLPGTQKWYYLRENGAAVISGWVHDKSWYYIGSDGIMITGWRKIDNKWYYFRDGGRMSTGWAQITDSGETHWYYFNEDGSMRSLQWLKDKEKWYYFDAKGRMLTDCRSVIDQVSYTFGADGSLTEEESPAAGVYDAMASAVLARHSGAASAVSHPFAIEKEMLSDAFGFDTGNILSCKGEQAMINTNCDMLLVVEAKDGKVNEVKAQMEEVLKKRREQFEWYGVMGNGERCDAAKVVSKGNFVALVMVGLSDGEKYDCTADVAAAVSAFEQAAK